MLNNEYWWLYTCVRLESIHSAYFNNCLCTHENVLVYAQSESAKPKCLLTVVGKRTMLAGKRMSVLPFCPFLLHKPHLSSSIREIYLHPGIKGTSVWLYDMTAKGILHNIGKLWMSIDAWEERAMSALAANCWSTPALPPYTDKATSRRGPLAHQKQGVQTLLEQEKQLCFLATYRSNRTGV